MRHMKWMGPVLFLLLAGLNISQAAETPAAKLSLSDAVSMALNINTDLKQARGSRESSVSKLHIAGLVTSYGIGAASSLNRDPDDSYVSGQVFGSMRYRSLLGTAMELQVSPYGLGNSRGSVGLTLRQPLMQGKGRLSDKAHSLLSAKSDLSIENKSLFQTQQSTVQNVVSAYYQAVMARERIKVQEKAVANAIQTAHDARRREEEGLVAGIEVSRAEIKVAQTKDRLNLQHASERNALDGLMLAIGGGVGQSPELTDSVPEPSGELPTLESAIKKALANRTELSVFDERLSTQERRLALANDQLKPRLDLVAGYNSENDRPGVIRGSFLNLGSMSAGFELSFPFDKRVSLEERSIAARDLEVLREMKTYQTEQIAEQVRSAYRQVESAKASLDIMSQNLKVAQDNLRLAQRMVEEGLATNREVLDAQDNLTLVENEILSNKTNFYLANLELKRAMGEDLTDSFRMSSKY